MNICKYVSSYRNRYTPVCFYADAYEIYMRKEKSKLTWYTAMADMECDLWINSTWIVNNGLVHGLVHHGLRVLV